MLDALARSAAATSDKESYFFERWVRDEWGRFGVRLLDRSWGGAAQFLAGARSFERAQSDFTSRLRDRVGAEP